MFFEYHQYNSGGSFDHYAKVGIGQYVFIEAPDADTANDRALDIGLYFDGVAEGRDAPAAAIAGTGQTSPMQ